jgi:hypothetical protein
MKCSWFGMHVPTEDLQFVREEMVVLGEFSARRSELEKRFPLKIPRLDGPLDQSM